MPQTDQVASTSPKIERPTSPLGLPAILENLIPKVIIGRSESVSENQEPTEDALLVFRLGDLIENLQNFLDESQKAGFSPQLCEQLWSEIATSVSRAMEETPHQKNGETTAQIFSRYISLATMKFAAFACGKFEQRDGGYRMKHVMIANANYLVEKASNVTIELFPHVLDPRLVSAVLEMRGFRDIYASVIIRACLSQTPEEGVCNQLSFQDVACLSEAEAQQYYQ